ncbi:MAG: hypothetical protein ABEH64_00290 [Salinirussus sp.]
MVERQYAGLFVVLIALSTLVITASLAGVLALTEGLVRGVGARIPYYVLAAAIVFVALVVFLEYQLDDGSVIITTSTVVAAVSLFAISLSFEGILFALENQSSLFANLLPYFLAAGLFSTGLIIWAVNHWREFVSQTRVR